MDKLLKQISENPDSIAELTSEQVEQAQTEARDFLTEIREAEERTDPAVLAELKDLKERLSTRADELQAEQAEYDAALAELENAFGLEDEEEEEHQPAPIEEPEETENVIEGNTTTEETETADEPELVTASAEKPKVEMGRVAGRIPEERKPRKEVPALIASASGERITDRNALAEKTLSAMRNLGKTFDKPVDVARFESRSEFVIDDGGSEQKGSEVLEAIQKRARQDARDNPESLTAALAFCAPAAPIYEQFGSVSTDGLLTLPTVTATRGRLTYPDSLSFQDLTGQSGIGNEWDGEGNKSVYTFTCPDTTTCSVVANVTILQFNNAEARFYPEAVADLNSKAMATAAQDVNARHIADIGANAKVNSLQGEDTNLGGIGNLANNLAFHAAEYREKYRLSTGAILDAVFPHWVFDALWADAYARDSTNTFGGVRAQLAQMLSDANVRPQFVYGYQDIAPDQFGTFPSEVDVLLWEPGTVVRLDSGTLDLGVVRDSTLNATNDYQTFVETFEAICVPGHEVLEITGIDICPSGATGDRVTVNCSATPS